MKRHRNWTLVIEDFHGSFQSEPVAWVTGIRLYSYMSNRHDILSLED